MIEMSLNTFLILKLIMVETVNGTVNIFYAYLVANVFRTNPVPSSDNLQTVHYS